MIVVSVQNDIKAVRQRLGAFDSRQIPFVIAKALTNTAQDAKNDLRAIMPRIFDRPTPYTLNSLYVSPATKQRLEATVKLKDDASGRGRPASKYLAPSIAGGARQLKGIEKLLSAKGILPEGMAVVPSKDTPRDAYGNVNRATFGRVISQIGGTATAAKRKAKTGSLNGYFVAGPGTNRPKLPAGIWAYKSFADSAHIRPVFFFVSVPKYRKTFDFFGDIDKTIKARFGENLSAAMDYALATSR